MKKDILKKVFGLVNSKVLLAVSAGMMMTSCVIYTGGYSETDGVYYDPNRDTLPEDYYATESGNRVGEYYDYQDTLSVENSYQGKVYRSGKYKDWDNESDYDNSQSDWGSYNGTEINYYNNSWGYPYGYYGLGYYPSYGWGAGFGWGWPSYYYPSYYYDPYWSFGFGYGWPYYSSGFGFGLSWGWGSGYYGGYYGGGYYGGGYYGYPGYGYINRVPYKRSGAEGGFRTATNRQGVASSNRTSGFRTTNGVSSTNRISNNRASSTNRMQQGQTTSGQRRVFNNQNNSTQRTSTTRRNNSSYERSTPTRSSSSGGFRSSGGFSGGTSRSGGFSGGGGSSRSGGFRR